MAREEADREDLLREATALVERVELRLPDEAETVVVGFRRTGGASFFFGADPVYQFNARGELRRAYLAGKLLKAEHGRLVELTRVRTADETQLVRRGLSVTECGLLTTAMTERLVALRETLLRDAASASFTVVGQVPEHGDVVGRVRSEIETLCQSTAIADSPHAGK